MILVTLVLVYVNINDTRMATYISVCSQRGSCNNMDWLPELEVLFPWSFH